MTQTFPAILSACAGPVALFSDFDGTLVEIAPRPDLVHVPSGLPHRLEALHSALDGAFAIVTGRSISDIDGFLSLPYLTVSGGHGAEQRRNGKHDAPSATLTEQAEEIAETVRAVIGMDERVIVETKPSGVAVHYRAAPDREADAHGALNQAIAGRGVFHVIRGKKVVEARPRNTNKGLATRLLMQEAPFRSRTPVFVGDDVTDEDAFAAVIELGGFGIKVGPGHTQAQFRIPDVSAVYALFDAIGENALPVDRSSMPARLQPEPLKEGGIE